MVEGRCPNCFEVGFDGSRCPQCSYMFSNKPRENVLPLGTILNGRYLLGRVLGIGGFGITYLAYDLRGNQRCAVKEYYPNEIAVRAGVNVVPSGERVRGVFNHGFSVFLDEARILMQFAQEPAIVHVLNGFKENETAYFVMEFLDGENLNRFAKRAGGRLNYSFVKEILYVVAGSLSKVHSKGLLHRDVSPENIFITKLGQTKLIDFGATRYYVGEASRSLSVILKPGFAPPEQYSSKGNQGPWTDIYALAATFYSVLTGVIIPDAIERLNGKLVPLLNTIIPEVDSIFAAGISKALELNYRNRHQSIGEFIKALEKGRCSPPKAQDSPKPYLEFVAGPLRGARWVIPTRRDITIGRGADSNIIVQANAISRTHCTLNYNMEERRFYIQDLSSNGTYGEAGIRLERGKTYALTPGNKIYLATKQYMLKVGVE